MKVTQFMVCSFVILLNSGVVSTTQVINGTFRGSVYFYESVPDNLLLQWNFGLTQIANRIPGFSPGCIPQYEERCQMFNNGTLKLDNLTSADDGQYTFNAVEPPATAIKTSVYSLRVYSVLSTPVISTNVSADRLISGTYVSLHCDAGSQTVTTYTFYRDGKNICSEPHVTCRDSNLYFQPITESNSGSYTCTIQNPISTSTSNTLQLSVSVPVSDVKLSSNISGLVWPGLDSVSLTCSARGANVSYSWSLQGAPLPQDPQYHLTQNNGVLTISPISAKDNGTFTCTATNWINSETSNGVNFNLASAVTAVVVTSNASGLVWAGQESVSLNCTAQGSAISFSWSMNGKPLSQDPRYHITQGESPPHSNLIIRPVSRSDAGFFTCTASNRFDSKTSSGLTLSLAWPPEGHMACLADSNSQYVQLTCSWLGGQPAANVTMVFSNVIETGLYQVTRSVPVNTIQGLTINCYGNYLEITSNCEQKFELPQSPGHNNNAIISVSDGQGAVMTVNLVSGLHAVFTWYRLTPELTPIQKNTGKFTVISSSFMSSLLITTVSKEDAGRYECRAKNIVGSQTFNFTVDMTASVCHGLGGGAVAGIVIGVVVGIAIIEVTVFFVLKAKRKRKTPSATIYENSNVPPQHIYSTTLPGTEMKPAHQEPHYEQLAHKNRSIYNDLGPAARKQ